MASRYWIGGTGNWNDTAHWAASSGGAGGETVPSSSDDVFIDSSSGFGSGGTMTINTNGTCKDFLSNSGHTYTITRSGSNTLDIYGSLTFENGITASSLWLIFYAPTSGNTIDFADVVLGGYVAFSDGGSGGEWTLMGDMVLLSTDLTDGANAYLEFYDGSFDANGYNVIAHDISFYSDATIYMGGGTWSTHYWNVDDPSTTFVPETSTIKLVGVVADDAKFYGQDMTYNNLWIYNENSHYIYDSNTFNDIRIDAGANLRFEKDKTQTISSLTTYGESGNEITLNAEPSTGQFTLSKSSGIVDCDYLNISNSNVTGGASWYAGKNSTDTTNNTGWLFEDAYIWSNKEKTEEQLHLALETDDDRLLESGDYRLLELTTTYWGTQARSSTSWSEKSKNTTTWTSIVKS